MRAKFLVSLSTVLVLLSLPFSSIAADLYFGVKTGPMMIDIDGYDDPTNGGIVVGYELGLVVADLAVEGEITRTLDEGKFNGQKVEVDTAGAYLAVRTAGPIYFKARAGVVSREETSGLKSDTNESFGLGIGFSLALLQIEVEFTKIDDDINFISVGVQF